MNYKYIRILILSASISLIGILITQSLWLRKTISVAEKQFDHRADQMLNEVVGELKTYSDTSKVLSNKLNKRKTCIFDVVDTVLLRNLITKYSIYHKLDSVYSFALVTTEKNKIVYKAFGYTPCFEESAYKVCLSCLWHEEYIHLSVFYPNKEKNLLGKQIIWIVFSILFILITIGAFIFIVFSIYKQKKISEIKNDFVNNMTHELKTPLSTISVASEVLLNVSNSTDYSRVKRYSKVIFEENQRMKKLVEKVLNIATLDRKELSIDCESIDLHKILHKTIGNFCFEACSKEVDFKYELNAENSNIEADPIHLRNIINNLVDNAVKYSGDTPKLTVTTKNMNHYLCFSISDNGKGIPKDSLNKVFDKFYRVPSGDVHNVKGFGLGLFYVKSMVELHGGKIEIQSVLNKGSEITIYLPQ